MDEAALGSEWAVLVMFCARAGLVWAWAWLGMAWAVLDMGMGEHGLGRAVPVYKLGMGWAGH
jgi:hypothetical protein